MPIHPSLKEPYPPDWAQISQRIRFGRAYVGRRGALGRSKTDAEARTVFGLWAASISRRIRAAVAGLGTGLSGHSGRVGMARRMAEAGAPTHEIMAQGRWKTARMVEVYTRAEKAGRAAQWLA